MEGKSCFRTRWSQEPFYSGGNITTVAIPTAPRTSAMAASDTDAAPTSATCGAEAIVSACGDTVNVVLATTGQVLCSYTLPVEDVILCVDAVSVLSTAAPLTSLKKEQPVESKKKNRKKGGAAGVVKKEEVDDEDEGATAAAVSAPELTVPLGSYIAVGTRSLQIYVLALRPIATPAPAAVNEEQPQVAAADANSTTAMDATEPAVDTVPPLPVVELTLLQSWTAAQQAISVLCFSAGGHYLISGSTDGAIKAWNVFHHHLTHNFRCPQNSLVQCLYLDPTESYLVAGSFEGHVTLFDFNEKTLLASARPHVQAVEAITLSVDGLHLFSIARDRRLSIQRIQRKSLEEVRAVVVKEHVSAATFESASVLHIGSLDGIVTTYRVSETEPVQVVRRLPKPPGANAEEREEEARVQCIVVAGCPKGVASPHSGVHWREEATHSAKSHGAVDVPACALHVADAGFNIHELHDSRADAHQYVISSTLIGFLDQILDIKLFPEGSHTGFDRVVVNNSKEVRLYGSSGSLSARSLQGHTAIVMCAAVSQDGTLIATGAKDNQVRFWSTETGQTVAVGAAGHTAEITALVFNRMQSDTYTLVFSISADENMRMWDVGRDVLPKLREQQRLCSSSDSPSTSAAAAPVQLEHRSGVNSAHSGPVFAVAVAPNDQFVATGGKDKTVNLWNITGKKIFREASLKGHRRGVSAVCFSPVDRVLASASNDGTVRLWSLTSLACLKTLQADRTAVLQLGFFNAGTQIVSGNAEGVLRVWAVGTSESVWSSELHADKIWALAVREVGAETVFYSGSADGVMMVVEDYTAEEVQRVREDRTETILKEQSLANAIRKGEFTDAFKLALQLNHPRHLRQVLVRWLAKSATECEDTLRRELLPQLTEAELTRLLEYTREWMANSRHAVVASLVTYAFLGCYHFTDIARLPSAGVLVEALLAYSAKHGQRQHDLLRRTYYIDFITRGLAPNTLTRLPPFVTADAAEHIRDELDQSADGLASAQTAQKKHRVES